MQQGLDTVDKANTQYGVSTRVGGVAQAAGGVAATAFGVGLCESGIGCVAGVPVAAYGVDNAVAGARAVYSGKNHATVGAKALSELTGMSPSTAEALYSAPSLIYGAKPIVSGLNTAGKVVAKETSQMTNATKHMVGEVGKDIKGGIDVASNLAQHGYVNTAESIRYVTEKGIEKSMLSARKLSDSIENTGVRNFGLAATAGGVGTGVSESIDYFNGKEMTESNLLGSFRSIMINSGTAGISNNLSSLQNLGVNTVFGVTVQGKDLKQAIAESSIGIGTGKVIDRTSKNLDSGTRNVISTFSSEVINKSLNDNAKEKKGEGND